MVLRRRLHQGAVPSVAHGSVLRLRHIDATSCVRVTSTAATTSVTTQKRHNWTGNLYVGTKGDNATKLVPLPRGYKGKQEMFPETYAKAKRAQEAVRNDPFGPEAAAALRDPFEEAFAAVDPLKMGASNRGTRGVKRRDEGPIIQGMDPRDRSGVQPGQQVNPKDHEGEVGNPDDLNAAPEGKLWVFRDAITFIRKTQWQQMLNCDSELNVFSLIPVACCCLIMYYMVYSIVFPANSVDLHSGYEP